MAGAQKMNDQKMLEKKENMTVKLDSAVGFKTNETKTAAETKLDEHLKAINHIYKDTAADDKFEFEFNKNDTLKSQKISTN